MKTMLFALLLTIFPLHILAQDIELVAPDSIGVDSTLINSAGICIDSVLVLTDSVRIEILQIDKNMVTGRWYETMREVDGETITPKHPDFYVFRPTGGFHIGESNEGVILFNRAGKYKIKDDSIQTSYLHMLNEAKPQYIQLNMKVTKISDTSMDIYMSHKDETPIYVRLKKAGSR